MYTAVDKCRICGNTKLERVLDLGEQMLTGVFPRQREEEVTRGPLNLVKCTGSDDACGLLQLEHCYDLGEMYGDNYGYRSGLNASMVAHLKAKVDRILGLVDLRPGDLVIDIGSNDSTTLQAYPNNLNLVGVDPTGLKFKDYYPQHITLIPDFFSADLVAKKFKNEEAKVITSFSMFYDLPAPMEFMRDIHSLLADDGIWVFEQSYMPLMLDTNSYDTVCHEHLEFYGLAQIHWMAERVGLKLVDVEFNAVNGGSFSVTAMKAARREPLLPAVQAILDDERNRGLNGVQPFLDFADRVQRTRSDLLAFVERARVEGKSVAALGASTKGNVLLQYCGFTPDQIEFVGEVNPDKFGCYTPGSWITIISEAELLGKQFDYLLVLPWHFRAFFEKASAFENTKLLFPLPEVEVFDRTAPVLDKSA